MQVAAHGRLGHRNGANKFTGNKAGQIFLLLLLRSMPDEVRQDYDVMERGRETLHAMLRNLIDYHHIVAEIAAVAAIFFWDRHAEQTRFARLAPELAFDLPVITPLPHSFFRCVAFEELATASANIVISSSCMNSGGGMSMTGIVWRPLSRMLFCKRVY